MRGCISTNKETSSFDVRLNAGVIPAFILGVGKNDINIKASDFKNAYWGFNGGLGFDFSVVTLDFNYEHAVSKALDAIEGVNANSINGRNRVFTISVGAMLPSK